MEAEPRHDLPVMECIDRLYASARVSHAIGANGSRAAGSSPTDWTSCDVATRRDSRRILARGGDYDASLERFGLRDRDVDQRIPSAVARRLVVREGLLALVLGPIAVAGLAVFALPYWLTGRMSHAAPDLQSRATWQVMGGACTYGVWIGLLAAAALVWGDAGTALVRPAC